MRSPECGPSPGIAVGAAITPVAVARTRRSSQHLADRVHDGIDLGPLLRRGDPGGRLEIFADAVVLLPALELEVEVDRLPLRVAVLLEPIEVRRQELRELADALTVRAPVIEGHEHRLDGDGLDGVLLPRVRVRWDRCARVELGD